MDEKPIEVHCPICGYTTFINDPDSSMKGLSREQKIERIRKMQAGDAPIFTCSGCDAPEKTPNILEIR